MVVPDSIRHSGESRYPLPPFRGKVGWGYIVYWMPPGVIPAFAGRDHAGMTVMTLL